ncbi:hypothetical protein BJX70DRAFT_397927 [Aspergillus crustosus]
MGDSDTAIETHPSLDNKGIRTALDSPSGVICHEAPIAVTAKPSFAFLCLPPETRLEIYKHLLVSRAATHVFVTRSWQGKGIGLHFQILRTCKTIYSEAVAVAYSRNLFVATVLEDMIALLDQIGPVNVKLIRLIDIRVPFKAKEAAPWESLISRLSQQASGLRSVELRLGSDNGLSWRQMRKLIKRGLGAVMPLMRALAGLTQLKTMNVEGYYAIHWIQNLKKTLVGVEMDENPGELYYIGPDDGEDEHTVWMRKWTCQSIRIFMMYQEATEDLML